MIVLALCSILVGGMSYYLLTGSGLGLKSASVSAEARAMVQRGVVFAAQGLHDKAITEFSQAIVAAPGFSVAYSNRGVVYMQRREYVKASDDLRKAVEIDPRDTTAHYNVAALHALQGERTLALDSLKRAFESGFTNFDALARDPDFDKLKRDLGFRELVQHYRSIR